MARNALPTGTLDRLIGESAPGRVPAATVRPKTAATAASAARPEGRRPSRGARPAAGRRTRTGRREPARAPAPRPIPGDPLERYAVSRGVSPHGGIGDRLRFAVQLALDLRDLSRKERVGLLTVVSRALVGYLDAYDRP